MEFKEKKLGELCDIKGGKRLPKGKKLVDFNTGHPYIRITDMYQNKEINLNKGIMYVEEDTYKSISKYTVNSKNVIIAIVGSTIGLVSIVGETLDNANLTENCVKFINLNEIIDEYLFYFLRSSKGQEEIRRGVVGSSQPKLPIYNIENIKIKFPSIENQKKIVKILSDLDKKIELNNRINDNLHELLKGIYDDWFEKYNYPNSNKNKHINWKRDKLGNYLKVERGLSYKGEFLSDKGTPMVNLGNVMPNGVFRIEKNKYYTGDYKEKVTANVGDIVIANTDMTQNREVLGTPVIIPPIYEDKIIYSHHIYGLKNLKLPKLFVFYSLLKPKFRNLAGGSATGTTVLALPKEVIEDYEIVIPDEETLNNFTELAEKIQRRRENIILENINLDQLRDILLPKLMNGEIELKYVST